MSETQPTPFGATSTRRKMIGTLTGLGAVAALAAATGAASADGQDAPVTEMPSGRSPRQIAAAFYASYNGDLAAGFERYISKDLVLHGFDGPNERSAWVAGDLELKASFTGYRLDVLDQIAEGTQGRHPLDPRWCPHRHGPGHPAVRPRGPPQRHLHRPHRGWAVRRALVGGEFRPLPGHPPRRPVLTPDQRHPDDTTGDTT